MVIYFIFALLIGFLLGWVWRDHKWVKASKTGKVISVDGIFYKVKTFDPENPGK